VIHARISVATSVQSIETSRQARCALLYPVSLRGEPLLFQPLFSRFALWPTPSTLPPACNPSGVTHLESTAKEVLILKEDREPDWIEHLGKTLGVMVNPSSSQARLKEGRLACPFSSLATRPSHCSRRP
jgi:hypothetical protein